MGAGTGTAAGRWGKDTGVATGAGSGANAGSGLLAGLVTQPSGSNVGASLAGAGGGGAFLKKLNIAGIFACR